MYENCYFCKHFKHKDGIECKCKEVKGIEFDKNFWESGKSLEDNIDCDYYKEK